MTTATREGIVATYDGTKESGLNGGIVDDGRGADGNPLESRTVVGARARARFDFWENYEHRPGATVGDAAAPPARVTPHGHAKEKERFVTSAERRARDEKAKTAASGASGAARVMSPRRNRAGSAETRRGLELAKRRAEARHSRGSAGRPRPVREATTRGRDRPARDIRAGRPRRTPRVPVARVPVTRVPVPPERSVRPPTGPRRAPRTNPRCTRESPRVSPRTISRHRRRWGSEPRRGCPLAANDADRPCPPAACTAPARGYPRYNSASPGRPPRDWRAATRKRAAAGRRAAAKSRRRREDIPRRERSRRTRRRRIRRRDCRRCSCFAKDTRARRARRRRPTRTATRESRNMKTR